MAPATTLGSHSCAKTRVWWIHRQSRWWSKNLGDGWHGGAVTALFRLKTQVMGPRVTLGPNHIVKTRVWHIHSQSRRWSINVGGGRHLVNNRVKVRVWGLIGLKRWDIQPPGASGPSDCAYIQGYIGNKRMVHIFHVHMRTADARFSLLISKVR